MSKRPVRPKLSDLQSHRPLPRSNRKRRRLHHELLERRDLLAAGTNYVYLDFTPDEIPGEFQPSRFVDTFTTDGRRAEFYPQQYSFLDYDSNGIIDDADAFIAADEIAQSVYERLKPFIDDQDIDVRVLSNKKDLYSISNSGWNFLNKKIAKENENAFVVYVGGDLQSIHPNFTDLSGVAWQGYDNGNHEWYGYALSEKSAEVQAKNDQWKAAYKTEGTILDTFQSGTDGNPIRAKLWNHPDPDGVGVALDLHPLVEFTSENINLDLEDIRPGDYIIFKDVQALLPDSSFKTVDAHFLIDDVFTDSLQISLEEIVGPTLGKGLTLDHDPFANYSADNGADVFGALLASDYIVQHQRYEGDSNQYTNRVSKVIAHELGHLLGLGHICRLKDNVCKGKDPEPGWNIMNYRSPASQSYFVKNPTPDGTELYDDGIVFDSFYWEEGINHRQAVIDSLTFDTNLGSFLQPSKSNIEGKTYLEEFNAFSGVPGYFEDFEEGDSFYASPEHESPPPATQGTVASTTVADIVSSLSTGFNDLRANVAGAFAAQFDFPGVSIPGANSNFDSLLNIESSLLNAISELDLASSSTLSDLSSNLNALGFSVDSVLSDAEFAALDSDAPADFIRVSRDFPLAGLSGSDSFDATAVSSLPALSSLQFAGDLAYSADSMYSVSFGVDTGGFYLLSGEAMRLRVDASGELGASLGTAVNTQADGTVYAYSTVSLNSINDDQRVRLSDLSTNFASHVTTDFSAGASLDVTLDFSLPREKEVALTGTWIWETTETGTTLLEDQSGFHEGLLQDQLVDFVGELITDLGSQAENIANQATGKFPFLGPGLSDRLQSVVSGNLEFDNPLGGSLKYLEDRGFTITPMVSASDFIGGTIGSTADLIRISYADSISPDWAPIQASGNTTLGPANITIAGNIDITPTIAVGLEFGFDFQRGPYFREGSHWTADLVASTNLNGSLEVGDLANVSIDNASITLQAAQASFVWSDGDGATDEKFYLGELNVGTLSGSNPNLDVSSGAIEFGFTLSANGSEFPLIGEFLSSQPLSWTASGTYDLATGTGGFDVDQSTLGHLIQPLTDIKSFVYGDFLEQLDQYNPLPSELRGFLTQPIALFQDKSLLQILGLGDIEILIDPGKYTGSSESEVNQGATGDTDHVLLNYDLIELPNIWALVMGQPADLFSIDIDKTLAELGTTLGVVEDAAIASFFGIVTAFFDLDVEFTVGFSVDVVGGLDTRGFYFIDDAAPILSVTGSINGVPKVTGALIVAEASFVEITGELGLEITGGIDLRGADTPDNKIRVGNLFADAAAFQFNTDLLHFDLAFDVTWDLYGTVGHDPVTLDTRHFPGRYRLYELHTQPSQPGKEVFQDLVTSVERKASQLKYCAITYAYPNPITALGCADPDLAQQIDKIVSDPLAYGRKQGAKLSKWGKEKGALAAKKRDEILDGLSDLADRLGIPDPVAGVQRGIDELQTLFGSGDWEYQDPPARGPTFQHRVVGETLYVNWAESHRPGRGWHADQQVYEYRLPAGYQGTNSPWWGEADQPIVKVHTNGWIDYLDNRFHVLDDDLTTTPIGNDIYIENSPAWVDVTVERELFIFGQRQIVSTVRRAPEYIQIRWDATNDRNGSEVQVAARIYHNGRVQFDYGPGNTDVQAKVGLTFDVDTPDAVFFPVENYHGAQNLNSAQSVFYSPNGDGSYGVAVLSTSEFLITPLYQAGPFPTEPGAKPTAFTIDQENPGAANLNFGLSDDGLSIVVDAPDFVSSEVIATRKSGCFDGCERDEEYADIRYSNRIAIPISEAGRASITRIVISGSNQPDTIVADPHLTIPVELYGRAGDDFLVGTSQGDTIHGGIGNDIIQGRGGDDFLYGDEDNDNVSGDYGNDLLDGGPGNDFLSELFAEDVPGLFLVPPSRDTEVNTLRGGDGDDVLMGSPGRDIADGGLGSDVLQGGDGDDELRGGPETAIGYDPVLEADAIFGGPGLDTLDGGIGNDLIEGGNDNDVIRGSADDDILRGQHGDDEIHGGVGNDHLEGGEHDDNLYGGLGADLILGQSGHDLLVGAEKNNYEAAGDGNDYLSGGDGNDELHGGPSGASLVRLDTPNAPGIDILYGNPGHDQLFGGSGPDRINGGRGFDQIFGGAGNDTLIAGGGGDVASETYADEIDGGEDNDQIIGSSNANFTKGTLIEGGPGSDIILADDGPDRILGGPGADSISALGGDDFVYGHTTDGIGDDAASDWIDLGDGMDWAFGGDGDDTIIGGIGPDEIRGGWGRDLIYAGEESLAGVDLNSENTIFADPENATIAPGSPTDHNDTVYGSAGNDIIHAGSGNNTVTSFGGNDIVIAADGNNIVDAGPGDDEVDTGDGDDTITAGLGSDIVRAGWGADLIYSGADASGLGLPTDVDTVDADPKTLSPFPGNELDHGDTVYGSIGADTVFAGLGDNVVTTFAGADTITAEDGNDNIDAGDDNDVVDAGDGDNVVNAGPGDDEVVSGAGNDTITAGLGSDIVRAGWGADLIYSGADASGLGLPTDVDTVDADPKTLSPFPGNELDHSDTVYGSTGADNVFAGLGNNVVTTFAGADTIKAESGDDTIDAGDDNDVVQAGDGDNVVVAGSGVDVVDTGTGKDTVSGGDGDDTIRTREGDDTIDAGDDNDVVEAGDGDDVITAGAGSDVVRAGWGADTIYSGLGIVGGGDSSDLDLIYADPQTFTVIPNHPTNHADAVVGSIGIDIVKAGPGNDVVSTLDGNDFIEGFDGADDIDAGGGDDIVFGHTQDRVGDDAAADTIQGGDGADQIWGGRGDDSLAGGGGADRIAGERGDDTINGGDDNDLILAGPGNDVVDGGSGNDHIEAGHGDDTVHGGGDNDVVLGQQGDDTLYGGSGNDDLRGGPGLDWIDGEAGNDIIDAGAGIGQQLFGGPGNDTITGSSDGATTDPDFFDTVYFGDVIDAGPGNDTVYGLGGADLIRGGDGDDHIESGTGSDHVIAGGGNDWVFVGFDLGEVVYAGDGNDTVIGSDGGDDELYGEAGQDDLYGQGGNDTLRGGTGADVLDGGAGVDRIEGDEGDDELRGGGGAGDQLLGGDGNDRLIGSDDGGDFIQGGPGRDTAIGRGGNDVLRGEAGDDVLHGGPGDDLLFGGLGSDVLTGDADHDVLYGHLDPATLSPADDHAVDYLYGDFATNQNEPGSGRDQLDGGGGNDLLFGEGDDDLIVSAAGDLVDYGSGESATPTDFVAPTATADPTIVFVDPLLRPDATLPTGLTDAGRWGEFSGSASGDGFSNAPTGGIEPTVAVADDGTRYVAWVDGRNGNQEVYVARHTDASGWQSLAGSSESGGVSQTPGESRRPSLAIDAAGNPVVAWTEVNGAFADIHVARYQSGTWSSLGTATNVTATGAADDAVLRNSPDGLVLAWTDRSTGVANGYLRRFDGSTWNELAASATASGITGSATDIEGFGVATAGGKIAVVWTQHVGDQTQIYVKEFAGTAWDGLSGSDSGQGVSAAITSAVDGSIAYWNDQVFVSWSEDDGPAELPGSQIRLVKFQTNSWSDATPQSLLPSSAATRQARLASGGGELYLSWTPQPRTPVHNTPIHVARFDGTGFAEDLPRDASGAGLHVGAMIPSELELHVSGTGKPYAVWQDQRPGEKPQVFLRGDRSELDLANRLFVADGSPGKSLGELLSANLFGPGDVILITGQLNEIVTIAADDSGLMIVGDHHASVSQITVNAADVTIQKLSVGTIESNADRLTLRESNVSQLTIASVDAVVSHNDLSGVDLIAAAVDSEIQHNRIGTLTLNSASGANIRHNLVSGGSGLTVQAASNGQIIANQLFGDPTGLTIGAAFDGPIMDNDIQGQSIGVQYDARAALTGNRISGSPIGVAATVVDLADAFGFVGPADPNQIFGNDIGVELTGRMQGQAIHDNAVGVIGTGVLGADDFTNPNRIENNLTGVDFEGEVRYNRIGYNEVGVTAKPGQLIAHNLLYRNTDVAIQIDAADDVRVVGNTAYAPQGDNLRVTGGSKRTEVWNNVLWAESGYDLYVDLDSREGFFSDYNVLHSSDTGTLVHWVMDFNDILDFQVDVNEFDLHSVGTTILNPEWSEPRFTNRWRDDYRVEDRVGVQRFTSPTLAAGNPILDAGRSITDADSAAPLAGHNVVNLLTNPSFESGLADWVTNPGSTTRDDNPVGYDFGNYFAGGSVAVGEAVQIIDLAASGVALAEIDSGDLKVHFGARLRSAKEVIPDQGRIELELRDGSGVVLSQLQTFPTNTTDRWELVGGVAAIPAGTRSARFIFTATRNTGNGNDAWMDAAFVRVAHLAYSVDAGPELNSPAEQPLNELPHVAIRFPDLYTDWERDKPKIIRWDSYNNQTDVPIKIDLYQQGPYGPAFVTTIVAATPDDGEYAWTPANSGVDYGTHDLMIHVSRSDDLMIFDRSTETFTVPEDTTTYYVNDSDQANDQYTTAIGATRHSGKTPDEPKRLPTNLLRLYSLGPNDSLFIDDGTYAQFQPIYLSGTIGVGDDEGFILTGPTLAGSSVSLTHLVPGTNAPLITLDDADFMTIQNLDLMNAQHGIQAKNLSTDATFSELTVVGHSSDGIRMEDGSTFSVAEQVTASNNGGHGIYTTGVANRLSDIVANNNGLNGVTIGGAIFTVEDIQANGNSGHGLAASGSIPTVVHIETTDNAGTGLNLALVTSRISDVQSLRNTGDGISASVQAGTEVLDSIVRDNGVVGIDLGGTGGTVKGNTIENNGLIGLSVGANSIVQSNTVIGNAGNGIRAGSGSVIGDADLTLGLGNVIRDNGANGVSSGGPLTVAGNTISGHTTGAGVSIRGGLVTQNLVFANRDGIVNDLRYGGLAIDGNRIYNNLNVGVEIGGGSAVRNNTIYSNANGIAIKYEYQTATDPAIVQNNLVYDHSGWAIQTATSNDVFENNTILQTTGNGISISGSSATRLRNNIVSVDEGIGVEIAPNSLAGLNSDFNLFQTGATGKVGRWNGFLQDSISAWQTVSNEDTNSIAGDPLFVDIDGPDNVLGYSTAVNDGRDDDFHLQSTEGRFTGSNAPVLDSASGLPVWLAVTELTDLVRSPAIDRGDISIAVTNEPAPHGGYVNLGAYGNTAQASKSPGDFLFVSTPNGSEVWAAERSFSISWRASDVGESSTSVVNIDLIRDSVTDVTPLLTAGMNVGAYDWTIPVSIVPADDYRIRITRVLGGDEVIDESDATFSIIAPISFYYVNDVFTTEDQYAQADGNDANDGLSPLTPKASIQSVLESYTLSPGDTILVDDGTYVLDTDIALDAALQGVTIQGPTVEAAEAVIDRNGGNAAFIFTGADDITIRNLTITNASMGVQFSSGDSDRIQILENKFFQNLIRGLYVAHSSGDDWLIADNQISETQGTGSGTSGYGIIVWDTDAEIRGNEVFDNPGGMYLQGSAISANDNHVHGNTVNGFFVEDGADLAGNLVHNNGRGISAFAFTGGSPINLVENTIYANGAEGIRMHASATTAQINAIGNQVYSNDIGIVATRHPNSTWPRYHGTISNNLIYGSLSRSLVLAQTGSGIEVLNNTIVADGHDAVRVYSNGSINFRNNLYSVSNGAAYDWTGATVTSLASNFNQFDLGTSGSVANLPSSTVTNLTDWILDQQQDVNSVSGDAQFVDPAGTADYHLAPGAIGIDAGDPATPVGDEPAPNGGRINVGAYGGTAEATVSPEEELTFVIAPNGLNRYSAGGTMRIEWTSTLDSPVNIDLYAATGYQPGVSVPVASIADDLVAAGVIDWSIPADGSVPLDTSYLVVVQSMSGTQPSDVSDAPFFIANAGNEYYVNDGSLNGDQYTTAVGDDLNLGKSPDQPMRSLGALLRSWTLSPGDVIYVDSGDYSIAFDIVLGTQHSGLTVQGPTNGAEATLDRGGGSAILQFAGADDVTVRNLSLTNAKAAVYGSGSGVTIEKNQFIANSGNGILVTAGTGWNIADNFVAATTGTSGLHGSYIGHGIAVISNDSIVENNLVTGNLYGITLRGGNTHAINNDLRDNRHAGITIREGASAFSNLVFGSDVGVNATFSSNYPPGMTIQGNTLFGNGDAMVLGTRTTTMPIYARDNRVFGNDRGIIAKQYYYAQDRFYGEITGNLLYDNQSAGLVVSYATTGTLIANNTIVADGHNAVQLSVGSTGVEVRNNLFSVSNGFVYDWNAVSVDSQSSDYNQFDLGTGGKLANLSNSTVDSFSHWVLYHRQDINGQEGPAGFVDPDGPNDVLGFSATPIGDPIVMDHQNAGFSTTGQWTIGSTQASGDEEFVYATGRENRAQWSFTGLLPGEVYQVTASFPGRYRLNNTGYPFSSAAVFNVQSDGKISGVKVVSQTGNSYSIVSQQLGSYQAGADGTLIVELEGATTSQPAVADSVTLQRVDLSFGEDDDFHLAAGAIGIDNGDPADSVGDEPAPNGGRINIGAYGGTDEATPSAADEILQVLSPNGLNRFSAGKTAPITWRSEVAGPVDIFLFEASGYQPGISAPVLQIADDIVASGEFHWTIPDDGSLVTDQEYLISIASTTGSQPSDVSDRPFLIANGGNQYYINDASLTGDVYTTAVGNDSNTGKSPDQPMADLQALLQVYELGYGDVVYIDTGVYSPPYAIKLGDDVSGVTLQGPVSETAKAVFGGLGSGTGFQFAGGDDITLQDLSITNFDRGISSPSVDSDRITIRDSEIYANLSYGIYLTHSTAEDWLIANNRIYDHSGTNDYGVYASQSSVEVRNNSIFGNYFGAYGSGTGAMINDNTVFNNTEGLRAYDHSSTFGNTVYGNSTGIRIYSGYGNGVTSAVKNEVMANDIGISIQVDNHFGVNRQVLISDNRIYNNTTGIVGRKSSRYSARVTADILDNYLYSNSIGIDLEYAATTAKIQNNLIYANTNLGVKLSISDQASVVNNTIVQEVGDVVRIEGSTDQLVLKNNILSTQSGNVLSVADDSLVNQFFDYNLLQQGTDPNAHIGLWGTTVLDSLTEWQTTTGLDANSLTGDPGFLDIDGADNILGYSAANGGYDGGLDDNFLLTAGSIAIDRGETATAPEFDILGNARADDPGIVNAGSEGGFVDLGSYEFQGDSSDSTPPTVIGSVPIAIHEAGGIAGTLTEITLSLSEAINEIDANAPAAYSLLFSGADGVFGNLDDNLIDVAPTYEAGSTSITLTTAESLASGSYRLTLFGSTTLHDASGLRLDGDGDGTAGGDYVREFSMEVDLPPTASDLSLTIDEDAETAITLVGDDGNPTVEQNLIFEITSLPTHGTLTRTPAGTPITTEQLPLQLTSSLVYFKPTAHSHQGSSFTFITRDNGSAEDPNHVSDPATVAISITPINDPPVISDQTVELGELSDFGITVATMTAADPDLLDTTADSLSYAIVDGNEDGIFQITQTGRVVLVAPNQLNFESKPTHQLTVQVTDGAGASDTGTLTVTLIDETEAQVEEVLVGGGDDHRSRIDLLTVKFNRLVELDFAIGGPFRLIHVESGEAVDLLVQTLIIDNKTVAELRFGLGAHVDANGNLADGRYQLTVLQSHVSAEGFALDGNRDGTVGDDFTFGAEQADQFFRLFGDADGDGDVDGQDYGKFALTFLKSAGDPGYNPAMDYDGDGDVDGRDFAQFRRRFLRRF